jgi:hypothetical protein
VGPGDNLLDVDGLDELRRSARRITAGIIAAGFATVAVNGIVANNASFHGSPG